MNIINSYRFGRKDEDAFKITVVIPSDGYEFHLPTKVIAGGSNPVDYDAYWGDGEMTNQTSNGALTHTYATAGTYQISVYGFMPYFSFGATTTSATTITSVDQWGNVSLRGMQAGFSGCTNLVSVPDYLDLSDTVLENESTRVLSQMFYGCTSLTTAITTNWNISGIMAVDSMFLNCSKLTSIDTTYWNFSSVIQSGRMFDGCRVITSVGSTTNWDTSSWDTLYRFFYNCNLLDGIDCSNWDVSSLTGFTQFCQSCSSLTYINISSFTNHSATDCRYMFSACSSLITVDATGFKADGILRFDYMFGTTSSLTDIIGIEDWTPTTATNFTVFFSSGSIPTARYDLVLKNWSAVLPAGSTYLDFRACTYTGTDTDVTDARTSINALGWTVRDGGAAA